MNCLEFKRLALSNPSSDDISYIEHAKNCADCLAYVNDVRAVDSQLKSSLDVPVPENLSARLELGQILESDKRSFKTIVRRYAKVACLAVVMFAGGFLMQGLLIQDQAEQPLVQSTQEQLPVPNSSPNISNGSVVDLVNHIEANPVLPVWGSNQANQNMQSLLAIYDSSLKLKEMERLQFSSICLVGRDRALHANLDTDHGQITFAYIKGEPVSQITDTSYKGYTTRIKPIVGGNLLIVSRNMYAMEQADEELENSLYWDI